MTLNHAAGFFEAIRSCSYITDPALRDELFREILITQRESREAYPTIATTRRKRMPKVTDAEGPTSLERRV